MTKVGFRIIKFSWIDIQILNPDYVDRDWFQQNWNLNSEIHWIS